MTYEDWEKEYFDWKKAETGFLDEPIPLEPQLITAQKRTLDRLKAKARRQKARAEYYYYQAVAKKRHELILEGYSKSAARVVAKDECARQTWLRLDTEGLVDSLVDRGFSVDWEYKRQENSKYQSEVGS